VGNVSGLFGRRRSREATRGPNVHVPPRPDLLDRLKPQDVRRALFAALVDSGIAPGFIYRNAKPELVRKDGAWTHRIWCSSATRANTAGSTADMVVTACAENSRLRAAQKATGHPSQFPVVYSVANNNVPELRTEIDPLCTDWATAFQRAATVIAVFVPLLDRFSGEDWLEKVQRLGDPRIPWPNRVVEVLIGEGRPDRVGPYLAWVEAHDPGYLAAVRRFLAQPSGVADDRNQTANVLVRHEATRLLPAES
jgi:hypothetical protein